jgi:hypothetical protein
MDQAEPFRARNYFNTARDLMREAQGIPRVWHEVAVAEIQHLMDRAETSRARNHFDATRYRVGEAQGIWLSTLGIPWPDFSPEVWHELDIRQMEQMSAFAEERLAEPRPPRLGLSQVSQHLLQTGRRVTWKPAHLSTVKGEKFTCPICIEDRDGDRYKHNYCKKTFCIGCLNKWAEYSRSCPLCRMDM